MKSRENKRLTNRSLIYATPIFLINKYMNKLNKWNALVLFQSSSWHQARVNDAPPQHTHTPASNLRTYSVFTHLRIWGLFDPDSFISSSISGPFEATFDPLRSTSVILGVCLSTLFGFTARSDRQQRLRRAHKTVQRQVSDLLGPPTAASRARSPDISGFVICSRCVWMVVW